MKPQQFKTLPDHLAVMIRFVNQVLEFWILASAESLIAPTHVHARTRARTTTERNTSGHECRHCERHHRARLHHGHGVDILPPRSEGRPRHRAPLMPFSGSSWRLSRGSGPGPNTPLICCPAFISLCGDEAEMRPANNSPFMMPRHAALPPTPTPSPSLHQPPQLHRNVVQQDTPTQHHPPPRCLHHRHHHLTSAAFLPLLPLPNKRDGEGKKPLGVVVCMGGGGQSTKRGFISVSFAPKEKRGAHI